MIQFFKNLLDKTFVRGIIVILLLPIPVGIGLGYSIKENAKNYEYLVRSLNSGNRYYEHFKNPHKVGDIVEIDGQFGSTIPAVIEK